MKKYNKGFTLIELLVVIAIIGILSSVVLASLNTARNKGADAAIKSNLANARAEAELFYDTGNTYTGVCTAGAGTIHDNVLAASKAAFGSAATVSTAAQTTALNLAVCHESATGWAASSELKDGATFFCVDSSGAAIETTTALGASDVTCD